MSCSTKHLTGFPFESRPQTLQHAFHEHALGPDVGRVANGGVRVFGTGACTLSRRTSVLWKYAICVKKSTWSRKPVAAAFQRAIAQVCRLRIRGERGRGRWRHDGAQATVGAGSPPRGRERARLVPVSSSEQLHRSPVLSCVPPRASQRARRGVEACGEGPRGPIRYLPLEDPPTTTRHEPERPGRLLRDQ